MQTPFRCLALYETIVSKDIIDDTFVSEKSQISDIGEKHGEDIEKHTRPDPDK